MSMRKVLTFFLIIAFSVTTILPLGYASEDNLRPFAARLVLGKKAGLAFVESHSTLPKKFTPPAKSTLHRVANALFPIIMSGFLFLNMGMTKQDGNAEKLLTKGIIAFIVVVIPICIAGWFSDKRRNSSEEDRKKYDRGAPWGIIIATGLSAATYALWGDVNAALAFMPGIIFILRMRSEDTLAERKVDVSIPDAADFVPKTEVVNSGLEVGRLLVEPLIIQIEAQLGNDGLMDESLNMPPETQSSSTGVPESISVHINSMPTTIPISRGQRILTAIATQA